MIIVPDAVIEAFINRRVSTALQAAALPLRSGSVTTLHTPIDIVIPVFNASEVVRNCIDRVRRFSPHHCTIWLVDDASTDTAIGPLLAVAQEDTRVRVIGHEENLGYVATVNAVLEQTNGDVIVLNSDTEVTEGWVQQLREAASDSRVGIVCPVSDNATILSVIAPERVEEQGVDVVGELTAAASREMFPEIPVAVGFCMLIRRRLVNAIGLFDPVFGAGYGEEVDYSLRAWRAGFRIVAATHCFVRHLGGQSFGQYAQTTLLRRLADRLITLRWPGYGQWVQDWWRDTPLRINAERLRHNVRRATGPRVLHILHRLDYLGGTEAVTRALVRGVDAYFPSTLVAVSTGDQGWSDVMDSSPNHGPGRLQLNRRFRSVNQRLTTVAADLSNPWVERVLARLLAGGEYAIVHVHHMVNWDSLLLPLIAKAVGARVAISLHDFYFQCPDYGQLRVPGLKSCGKKRALAGNDCEPCLNARRWVRPGVDMASLGAYLESRHALLRRALAATDLITAPSEFSAQRLRRTFGDRVAHKIVHIPHGTDIRPATPAKKKTAGLVVSYFGGTIPHKGFGLVWDLARRIEFSAVCFQVYGAITPARVPADRPANLELMGKYEQSHIADILVGVDLVVIPTRFEETFNLVLSEAWACGVPVMASNSGALSERISDGVDGWLLDPYDKGPWIRRIRHFLTPEGRRELETTRKNASGKPVRRTEEMIEAYRCAYQRLLDAPSVPVATIPPRSARMPEVVPLPRIDEAFPQSVPRPPRALANTRFSVAVIVLVDAVNATWLGDTLASLGTLKPQSVFVIVSAGAHVDLPSVVPIDEPRQAPALCKADWYIMLCAGDRMSESAREWLALAATKDRALIYADATHVSVEGYRYAPTHQPSPDLVLGLQCPLSAAGCMWSAEALARLPASVDEVALIPAAASLWAAVENLPAHHLPLPLFDRLDVNSTALARGRSTLVPVAQKLLGNDWLVVPAGPTWQVTPRVRTAPPHTGIVVQGDEQLTADTRAWLSDQSLRATRVVTRNELAAHPNRLDDCDYILQLPAGTRFEHPRWLDVLRAWAVYTGAVLVAPRSLGLEQQPLETAYRLELQGLARPVPDPADTQAGLAPADWFPGNRSTVPVLSRCVLLKRRAFEPDQFLDWPSLGAQKQLDLQLEKLAEGETVLLIRDVAARLPDSDAGAGTIVIEPRHHRLARNARWFPPDVTAARPCSDYHLSGTTGNQPSIIATARNSWAAAQYRIDSPLRYLHSEGCIEAPLIYRTGNQSPPSVFELEAAQADVVMAHNFISDPALARLRDYRILNVPVIASLDDLLTDVPAYNAFNGTYPDIRDRLHRALQASDRLVTSTPLLGEYLSDFCSDIVVVPNALADSPWLDEPPPGLEHDRRLRVGWAGASQHAGDLEAFASVVKRTCGRVDWVFFGMCPDTLRPYAKEVHAMVPFARYCETLRTLDLDLGVAPLLDNAFNRCKSHVKLLEYGALGLPVVASDLEPYRGAPVDLARNADEWTDRILHYAADRPAGIQAGARLRDWVRADHLVRHRKRQWLRALGLSVDAT